MSVRAGLLATTAILLAGGAFAGPAPSALPQGGSVIAGQAHISQATPTHLQVTQTSTAATVNWNSFSVGGSAKVTFTDPTPQSITINRVTGPDPSVIAGQISSNGRLVLTNQSGITVLDGAKIDTQSLVLSAPGITEANARAGKLVFDQPARPGAVVSNAGTITVAKTGLAALVAPSVANSGVIRAPLGTVVLAGAEAHTVDFYGDGLLSIDVTKQVSMAPVGPDGKKVAVLVSNTGTIVAHGGNVLLTASAVDGLVQTLVNADGRISASGANGGGQVAIRAQGGDIVIPAAARISANARTSGNGGKVSVIASNGSTTQAGRISARGAGNGRGGSVEVSGDRLVLGGAIDTGAPSGQLGTILFDPTDVIIANTLPTNSTATLILPATLQVMTGNVTVSATGNLSVASGLDFTVPGTAQSLVLTAANNIAITAPITLVNNGYKLTLVAGGAISLASALNVGGTGIIDISAGAGVIQASGPLASGALTAGTLLSSKNVTGNVLLGQGGNRIATLGDFTTIAGRFTLNDSIGLTQVGSLSASTVYLSSDSNLVLAGSISAPTQLSLSAGDGVINSGATPLISLAASANVTTPMLTIYATNRAVVTAVMEASGASINGNTAIGGNIYSGNVILSSAGNAIGKIDGLYLGTGDLTLRSATLLTVSGPLNARNASLTTTPGPTTPGPTTPGNNAAAVPGILFSSDVNVAGTLSTVTTGTIVRNGGSFNVGTLTGSAIHLADFGIASVIGTLRDYSVTGSVLLLNNAAPLTVQGTIQSEFFSIAATGTMTWTGTIITLGVSRSQNTGELGANIGSSLIVLSDAAGNAVFQQVGVATILPSSGNVVTMRIQLPSIGGSIVLNDLSAPAADLVLFNPAGSISGTANVSGLVVMGRAGSTDLAGVVSNPSGANVTTTTTSLSSPDNSYRLNACAVGSVNCLFGPVNLQIGAGGVSVNNLPAAPVVAGELAVPLNDPNRQRNADGT